MSGIWVVLEERGGRIGRISWEAVAAGQQLASQLNTKATAIVIGAQTESLAAEAAKRALRRSSGSNIRCSPSTQPTDSRSRSSNSFVRSRRITSSFRIPTRCATYAPALAARLNRVLISDVTAIGEGPAFTRQLMQGRLNGSYRTSGTGPCFHLRPSRERFAPKPPRPEPPRSQHSLRQIDASTDPHQARRALPRLCADSRSRLRTIHRRCWPRHQGSRTISRSCRISPPRSARSSLPRAPSATTAGCPWNDRSEAPARRSRLKCISPSESRERSSISSA